MLLVTKCPNCGAEMEVDDSKNELNCPFCGSRIVNMAQRYEVTQNINQNVVVTHKMDHSNEPNLVINYTSSNIGVMMVTRIVATGQKNTYQNGQTMTFRLAPGKHLIVLKIGNKNYNREIYIGEQQVRINASYNGRAYINIDQPQANLPYCSPSTNIPVQNNAPVADAGAGRQSGLGIAAFVLSLSTGIFGLILGIIDLYLKAKNKDNKRHGLAIAAIIVGGVYTLYIIAIIITYCTS